MSTQLSNAPYLTQLHVWMCEDTHNSPKVERRNNVITCFFLPSISVSSGVDERDTYRGMSQLPKHPVLILTGV